MLQAILFDLDGTLLPMDNDHFTQVYFQHLAATAAQWGYTDAQLQRVPREDHRRRPEHSQRPRHRLWHKWLHP